MAILLICPYLFDLSNKFILLISLREAIYKGKLNGLPPAGKLKKDFSSCAARINKFDKRAEGGHTFFLINQKKR